MKAYSNKEQQPGQAVVDKKYPYRVVTATTLFDGHDVAVNMIRRLLQSGGAEVIHLGHNRSAEEIVRCAIEEDAHAVAITSYQGGHLEFFKYLYDLLQEHGAGHIRIFGGGGGTILPTEMQELHDYGIARIYSPDDGRALGLEGMIEDLFSRCLYQEYRLDEQVEAHQLWDNTQLLGRMISIAENNPEAARNWLDAQGSPQKQCPVIGITGTGGAGKSSLIDELSRRFLLACPEKKLAVICVDPSLRKTGGALLGDRIRINAAGADRIFVRSIATRASNQALSDQVALVLDMCRMALFDAIILESSGTGQSDVSIVDLADIATYVMTAEFGAPSQLEKINMLDYADFVVLNKFNKSNAADALQQVKKQYHINHPYLSGPEAAPVFGTNASIYNDAGVNAYFEALMDMVGEKGQWDEKARKLHFNYAPDQTIIPARRAAYLDEIVSLLKSYEENTTKQSDLARSWFQLRGTILQLEASGAAVPAAIRSLEEEVKQQLDADTLKTLESWEEQKARYEGQQGSFKVGSRELSYEMKSRTLSGLDFPKVGVPAHKDWGEIVRWSRKENFPGFFPFTAGVFPMKREGEEPTRLTAGEGGPERSNRRFHYLTRDMKGKRISTAHDSVTLYGHDPDYRPDIYGKIGSTGVSVSKLDDAKIVYSGFRLTDPATSVNLTINGPAPGILAFFLNAAVDQECEVYIRENGLLEETEAKIEAIYAGKGWERPRYQGELPPQNDGLGLLLLGVTGDQVLPAETYEAIKAETLRKVRGTVQCDILKEDQAQNTCIFSTEFSLKMMADIQEYFIEHQIKSFYSVSISGYHIAEAGANPVTQMAFTLANGFTYIEYYLSRGMHIDEFAANFSFFFSMGTDPEYQVLGRVCRRIWAKVLKLKYGASERAQKLKYHVQTSGRSLHAQEIDFNDIRTTLQALYAIYDNCNSLHTNANDEAISIPTEQSVRKALAIQMVIDKELGMNKNQNPLQGSFIIEQLTDLVEEAVIMEFNRIAERGGVLSSMETMYQRSRIQEESMHYEMLKHTGELPIIGVNTFKSADGSPTIIPDEVVRIDHKECDFVIARNEAFKARHAEAAKAHLQELRRVVGANENIFDFLMQAGKYCTLEQISQTLFEVGGKYRRNL